MAAKAVSPPDVTRQACLQFWHVRALREAADLGTPSHLFDIHAQRPLMPLVARIAVPVMSRCWR